MVHIWSSKWMDASQASKKNVVIQNHYVAHSVSGMKSTSGIRDDYGLYTEKLEDSNGICDLFYRVPLKVAF
jgi:hypothetical protein